jgi:hypothetical protein
MSVLCCRTRLSKWWSGRSHMTYWQLDPVANKSRKTAP